jgi:hypothetical protein
MVDFIIILLEQVAFFVLVKDKKGPMSRIAFVIRDGSLPYDRFFIK